MELDFIKGKNVLTSNIIVVVPEQFAFDAEKYLIDNMASEGLFHARVYGLKKLLYEFSYLVGIDQNNIISDFGKILLMMKVLEEVDDKLELYKASYRSKSYVELIISQMDALRNEGLQAEDLYELSKDIKVSKPVLSKKLYEMSLILDAYLACFEKDKIDEIELTNRLTEYFLSKDKHFLLDEYSFIVDGFSGMSSIEVSLITAIASKAEESFIRVIHAKTGVASRYSHHLIAQIEQAFNEINEKYIVEEISMKLEQADNNALAFASLFDYEGRKKHYKPNMEIIAAKNKDEEITYIAQDILNKMKTSQCLWSDFAIVASDITSYEYPIDKIFLKYGIPYFRDESIPVSTFDYILFIISSLKAVQNNFSNKQVLDCLKLTAKFTMDEAEFSHNYSLATDIERYVLTMKINYDRWFQANSFQFLYRDKDIEKQKDIIRYKDSVIHALRDLKDDLTKADSLKKKLGAVKKYLAIFNLEELIKEKILYYAELGDEDQERKYTAIQKAIQDIFEQIEVFTADIKLSTNSFIDLFISAISLYKAGITPPNTLKVLSGSIERTKFLGLKYLYIVGVSDGVLPSSKFSSKAIFTSNELAYLDESSPYSFKTVSKFMDKEIYDVYEKILLTSEQTIFTYPMYNQKMEEVAPSIWVKNLKKIYDIEEHFFDLSIDNISKTGVKNPFYDFLFLNKSPKDVKKITVDSEFMADFDSYINAEKNLQTSLNRNVDKYVNKVSKFTVEDDVNKYKLSVSRLEKQALCPYGFFVEYALKPVQNEYDDMDYRMVGNVYHRALEYFVKEYLKCKNKEEFIENSEVILKDCFIRSQEEEEVLRINTNLKDRLHFFEPSMKYIARAILSQLDCGDDCQLDIICEKEFTHTFKNEDKELFIEGKIDRLDIVKYNGKNYLRVVDYKTGMKEFKMAEVEDALQLQLLTYLKALLDGEYKGAEVLGAFYHSIREGFSDDGELVGENCEKSVNYKEILKQYRLSGRYIEDKDLLKAVDKELSKNGESLCTNIKLSSKGSLNRRSATLVDREGFEELFEITIGNIWKLVEEIDSANVSIKNHDSKEYPCPYCGYNGILKLDKNKYRHLF